MALYWAGGRRGMWLQVVRKSTRENPGLPTPATVKVKETRVLTTPRSCAILEPLDILVDIGVPAEKEVIQ